MKTHQRDYPYRPPRRERKLETGSWNLLRRFAADYLAPFKWRLAICVILVTLNGCSFYLMTYFTRVVVDHILVVEPANIYGAGGGALPASADRGAIVPRSRARIPRSTTSAVRSLDHGQAIRTRPPDAGNKLFLAFALFVASLVVLNVFGRLAHRGRITIGQQLTTRLREDLHKKILDLSLAYHQRHTPGRLLSRITSDVEIVQRQMLMLVLSAGRNLFVFLIGAAILLTANWRMGLIVLGLMPLYATIYRKAAPSIRKVSRELRHTNSCMYGLVSQKLDAIKVIHSAWRQRLEQLNFHRLAACFLRDALTQQRLSRGMTSAAQIISGLATGSLFLLGTRYVLRDDMTLGEMLYLYGIAAALFAPILELTMLSVRLNHVLIIIQRVIGILDHPVEIDEKSDAVPMPHPIQRRIALRNVGFRYAPENETDPVLQAVSLTISAGHWLCVMGPSGAGKSTLIYLLARLYEPTWGRILVDDVPLQDIQIRSLRERISLVPQEARIFSGTVRDNICYGFPHAEPRQIMRAAKAAELHDFIMDMPVKYETMLGEKGVSLSGGQRQRLSLARALLTDPDLLLLDDCMSALDADTERRIQQTLARTLEGKTAVIVSQRVSMAMRCHRICTLEDGAVTEFGSHDQLLRNNGFYARLHAQQTSGADAGQDDL